MLDSEGSDTGLWILFIAMYIKNMLISIVVTILPSVFVVLPSFCH